MTASAPFTPPDAPTGSSIDPGHHRITTRDLLAIVGVWTFLAALTIAGRLFDPRVPGLPPQVNAAVVRLTLVEYTLWMLLTPPLLWFAARLSADDRRRVWNTLLAVVVGIAIAVLVDTLVSALRTELLASGARRAARRPRPFGDPAFRPLRGLRPFTELGFVDDLMVYFAVLFAGLARATALRDRARRLETVRLQASAAALRSQLAEARLDALRAQLDPHFLFNTLNAVSALVERDPRGVRRMISRLSDLLRHTLEGGADELSLDRELVLLDRYLDIMRVRFGDRLRVELDVAPELRTALVPNLILQPLVENAIKHGVADRESGGSILVAARREGERLVLTVMDDGPGPAGNAASTSGPRVGLENTRARLRELYGAAQHLQLRRATPLGGALVEVALPYREIS